MQKKILSLISILTVSPDLLSMSCERFNAPHIKSATQALAGLLSHEELEQSLAETNAAREEWESTSAVKQELQGLEKELDSLRKLQEEPNNMFLPYDAETLPQLFARNHEEADNFREVMALERTPSNAIAPQKLAALAVCAAPKKQQGAKRKSVNKTAQQPPQKKQATQATERPFPCKYNCGKTFTDPSSRLRHEKNHINPNKGNFYCYTCHTEYKYKKSFINHGCNV